MDWRLQSAKSVTTNRMSEDLRKCPECKTEGISIDEIHPDGTRCRKCGKHIEVDATFVIVLTALLIILMLLDIEFSETGYLGVLCAIVLIFIGAKIKFVYSRFMPLRHYED